MKDGEPPFVVLLPNIRNTSHLTGNIGLVMLRSRYFQTLLYFYLNSTSLLGNVARFDYRQNSTSATSNADDLQAILAGNVTAFEYDGILDDLLVDPAGRAIARSIDLFFSTDQAPGYPLLYSLPDGAVRLVGYRPPRRRPGRTTPSSTWP